MRAFRVYFFLSGILITIGILSLIPPTPVVDTRNLTLDPGYYYYVPIHVFKAGQISGTFSESQGRMVRLYVFDSGQFDSLQTDGSSPGLFASEGSSGTFSAIFQVPGTFYLVVRHGSGIEQSSEAVRLNYRLEGENFTFLGLGFAGIVVGVALWVAGTRRKRTEERRILRAQDVVLFNRPLSPQQAPSGVAIYPPAPLVPAQTPYVIPQPVDSTKRLQERLQILEGDVQRMDVMRQEGKPLNLKLFEREYATKLEQAAEIRRKLQSQEP